MAAATITNLSLSLRLSCHELQTSIMERLTFKHEKGGGNFLSPRFFGLFFLPLLSQDIVCLRKKKTSRTDSLPHKVLEGKPSTFCVVNSFFFQFLGRHLFRRGGIGEKGPSEDRYNLMLHTCAQQPLHHLESCNGKTPLL